MAYFFQRVAVAIAQSITQFNNFSLTIAQRLEHLGNAVAQHFLRGTNSRVFSAGVGKQVTEVAVFTVAHRSIKANRIATHGRYPSRLVDRRTGPSGNLFNRWLATVFLQQLSGYIADPRHCLDHVYRNADRAALVGNCSRNCLPNPPGGIRTKLKTTTVFKLINSPHQAGVAFLDKVEKRQAAIAVFFGDRHNQSEIPL